MLSSNEISRITFGLCLETNISRYPCCLGRAWVSDLFSLLVYATTY